MLMAKDVIYHDPECGMVSIPDRYQKNHDMKWKSDMKARWDATMKEFKEANVAPAPTSDVEHAITSPTSPSDMEYDTPPTSFNHCILKDSENANEDSYVDLSLYQDDKELKKNDVPIQDEGSATLMNQREEYKQTEDDGFKRKLDELKRRVDIVEGITKMLKRDLPRS